MFEQINLFLFSIINAGGGLGGLQLGAAVVLAEWLIMLIPITLVLLWLTGAAGNREAAVRACLAALCALGLNQVLALILFHPRPFMLGIGHTYLAHAPDSSFPSDHVSIIMSVALTLAFSAPSTARRAGFALIPFGVCVAWGRVFLGVHYPLDMAGALLVAAGMALLVRTGRVASAAVSFAHFMQGIYRRLLAAPIARGWLRP